MPATGPGAASVRARITSKRICHRSDRLPFHARAQARTAVIVAAQAASTRLVWIGSQLSEKAKRSVPASPESDHTGGRPSLALPPTLPARQIRL